MRALHSPSRLRQRRSIFRCQSPGHAPATPGTLVGRLEPGRAMQRQRMGGRLGQKLCSRQKVIIRLSAIFSAIHTGGGPSLMLRAKCQCIMAPDERFKGPSSFLICCEPLAACRTCKWGAEVDLISSTTAFGQPAIVASNCKPPPRPAPHTRPMPSNLDAVPGPHNSQQKNGPIPSSRWGDTALENSPPSFLPSSFSWKKGKPRGGPFASSASPGPCTSRACHAYQLKGIVCPVRGYLSRPGSAAAAELAVHGGSGRHLLRPGNGP